MEHHVEIRRSRLVPIIEKMMDFALQTYKGNETTTPLEEQSQGQFPLPDLMKIAVKYVVDQLKDSDVVNDYLAELHHPNRTERLFNYLRYSFDVCERDSINTSFIEWASMTCLIAAACVHQGGFDAAKSIAVQVIYEVCVRRNEYDEFKKLGCDI